MKYLMTFESVGTVKRSSRNMNDKEFIHSMEDNIEGIFIDMIDDEFELDMTLTDWGGNCGSFSIKKWRNDKSITEYLDTFHRFFDYITRKGYSIKDINCRGWIKDERDKTIYFGDKNWEFIEEQLIRVTEGRPFNGLYLYFNPIKTKWVKDENGRGDYVPLYKLKNPII
jgi:hypothetical protein